VLNSGAGGPGFKSQSRRCHSIRQTVHTHRAFVHQVAKLVVALVRVAGVTAGLAESNQSINQSIKTLIHVDRPQRDNVHMVKIKIKSTMIHNNNNLSLNM